MAHRDYNIDYNDRDYNIDYETIRHIKIKKCRNNKTGKTQNKRKSKLS